MGCLRTRRMTLEELNKLYSEKSTQIVKDRKMGAFKTVEEDKKAQQEIWLWYLDEKAKITGDNTEVIKYLKAIAVGRYQDFRSAFHHYNKIDKDAYKKGTIEAFEWLEDELVKRGLLDKSKITSKEKKHEYLDPAKEYELDYVKTHTDKKSREFDLYLVCKHTGKIVQNYFDSLGI